MSLGHSLGLEGGGDGWCVGPLQKKMVLDVGGVHVMCVLCWVTGSALGVGWSHPLGWKEWWECTSPAHWWGCRGGSKLLQVQMLCACSAG